MAKIVTKGVGLNPAAELAEWRLILAQFGKKLPKSRYKIINGYVHYHGTIDILSLYWLGDLHVARKKSSLTGERFIKEKCFKGSRRSAERFAEGNRLASKMYALVDEEKKVYSLFCFLKKKAILLIKEGKSNAEAEARLMDYLNDFKLLAAVGTCQRHVLSDHPGKHDIDKVILNTIEQNIIPSFKMFSVYNLKETDPVHITDTG